MDVRDLAKSYIFACENINFSNIHIIVLIFSYFITWYLIIKKYSEGLYIPGLMCFQPRPQIINRKLLGTYGENLTNQ